uniref:Coenzyme A transferase n=1 Tax=Ascaris lumbricoides TaxID=6252 RepID=A0A0M3ITV6_ASCLU
MDLRIYVIQALISKKNVIMVGTGLPIRHSPFWE